MTAQLFTPGRIIAIDLADAAARRAPASSAPTSRQHRHRRTPIAGGHELTDGLGADVAIEAVGVPGDVRAVPPSWSGPGGHVANIGVHGAAGDPAPGDAVDQDVTITTGLVDTSTTPTLLRHDRRRAARPDARSSPTASGSTDMMEAYDVFANAANTGALKVVLNGNTVAAGRREETVAAVGNGGVPRRRLVHG